MLGNRTQAIKDYDKAIELDPQDAMAYYDRGLTYNKLGNYQQAIADVKIAARLRLKEAQDLLKKMNMDW